MSFLLNHFRSSNGTDIELNDLEAGNSADGTSVNDSSALSNDHQMESTSREDGGRSAITTYRESSSTTSTYPPLSVVPLYRFSSPNTRSSGDDPMPMISEIPRPLPPVEKYGSSMKRSHKGAEREITDKVRIVEQAGFIPHKRVVQMNQKISQEYGDQFRRELAKQKALLDEQMMEAARKIEEANKRASEAIVSANARAEEAEKRACVRAKEAIAEASARAVESANARLEVVIAARAEEIEHQASERANKAIAEASIRAEETFNARAAQAEEAADARAARAEEAALTRAQDIERRWEEIARISEEKYKKAMERFRMMFEEKIEYAPGPMNVDWGQQAFAEADPSSLPNQRRANGFIEVNQGRRDQTSDSEAESLLRESDNEFSTNSPPREILVGELKARAHDAGNKRAFEGQGPMEVVDEVPEAWNGESHCVSPGPNESIRGDSEKLGIENLWTALPPPQRFAPPRGGGGPGPYKMSASRQQRCDSEGDNVQEHPSGTHQPSPILKSNRQRSRRIKGVKTLYTREGYDSSSDDDVVTQAMERRHPSRKARMFQQTPLRGFNSERARRMTSVRKSMNELLGIKKDDDMRDYIGATAEEVESYHAGTGAAPVLRPMRLYLETKQCVIWNDELSELFLEHYEEELNHQLTPDQRTEIEEFFENRLHQLGRKWREFRNNGVDAVDAKREARASNARANTRRAGLYDDRMLICLGNVENPDGSRNERWYRRLRMVKQLGANGMSSDESDTQAGYTIYNVKKRAWRSDQVTDEVREIDKDRNTTNAHGGRRAGNTPRERKRLLRPNVSTRDPTLCCPENYYQQAFIATLNNRALRELGMRKSQNI